MSEWIMDEKCCDILVVRHQSGDVRCDPVLLDVVYSDDRVRIMRLWDESASPWEGRWVVRVDIYDPVHPAPVRSAVDASPKERL